jgi:hypothetical protein
VRQPLREENEGRSEGKIEGRVKIDDKACRCGINLCKQIGTRCQEWNCRNAPDGTQQCVTQREATRHRRSSFQERGQSSTDVRAQHERQCRYWHHDMGPRERGDEQDHGLGQGGPAAAIPPDLICDMYGRSMFQTTARLSPGRS